MARTVSKYFNPIGATGEQRLVEDLVIESIRINGMAIKYIPRTLVSLDQIFGEDQNSSFENFVEIEAYFDNAAQGFGGDRYLISKFGLEMRETCSFIVSRRRFNEVMRHDGLNVMPKTTYTTAEVRPMNGDLIYFPLTNDLFEIKFAEHESVFYQIGYRYIWRIDVQKFDYAAENFTTGDPLIDRVQVAFDNVDSVINDPLADNETLLTEAETILNTTEHNVLGDPI